MLRTQDTTRSLGLIAQLNEIKVSLCTAVTQCRPFKEVAYIFHFIIYVGSMRYNIDMDSYLMFKNKSV